VQDKVPIQMIVVIFVVALALTVGVEILLYKMQSIAVIILPASVYLLIFFGIIPRSSAKEVALSAGLIAGTVLSFVLFRLR
jgi:Na+/proline symporter